MYSCYKVPSVLSVGWSIIATHVLDCIGYVQLRLGHLQILMQKIKKKERVRDCP